MFSARFESAYLCFLYFLQVMRPIPHPLAFCLDTTKRLLEKNLRVQPSFVPQVIFILQAIVILFRAGGVIPTEQMVFTNVVFEFVKLRRWSQR